MLFLVKVRVNTETLKEFGIRLVRGELDRSLIRGETHCLADDPAVGYSLWEAETRGEFEAVFSAWKEYYSETQVQEVISAKEAQARLMKTPQ